LHAAALKRPWRSTSKGDGRALPKHFDPRILEAFRLVASQFDEIFETFVSPCIPV
jgi:hypothetical protein